jgi:hypothetical protein
VIAAASVAVAVALIAVRYLALPQAEPLRTAQRMLTAHPKFAYAGESGRHTTRCVGPSLFGLFSTTDRCSFTFPSGHVYRCTVYRAWLQHNDAESCIEGRA